MAQQNGATSKGRRPRALVTNDDGIGSVGLVSLARAALSLGLDVVVAAPDKNLSGASASLTALQADRRVVVSPHKLERLGSVPAFAVAATPAFITLLATRGAFGEPPDLVLSGINQGHNAGQAILHSGTVGAAMTAAAYGRRAMAVSLASVGPALRGEALEWATAEQVAGKALPALVLSPPRTLVNINVPNVPPGALRGLRRATLSTFGSVQANVVETGQGYISVEMADVEAANEPGTDAALLAEGWATFTCLSPMCEVDEPCFDGIAAPAPANSSSQGAQAD